MYYFSFSYSLVIIIEMIILWISISRNKCFFLIVFYPLYATNLLIFLNYSWKKIVIAV